MRRAAGKPESHLVALGFGDPAFGLENSPGNVVLLGADQAEDVFLALIFAHQSCGQSQAAAGLDIGRDPEDRGRQQMHFVVDDQAPIALVEQVEMGEVPSFLGR